MGGGLKGGAELIEVGVCGFDRRIVHLDCPQRLVGVDRLGSRVHRCADGVRIGQQSGGVRAATTLPGPGTRVSCIVSVALPRQRSFTLVRADFFSGYR